MERMRTPHSYVPRDRILTPEELRKVWRAADNDSFGRIVKILILTGQRVVGILNSWIRSSIWRPFDPPN
jgi:integrase